MPWQQCSWGTPPGLPLSHSFPGVILFPWVCKTRPGKDLLGIPTKKASCQNGNTEKAEWLPGVQLLEVEGAFCVQNHGQSTESTMEREPPQDDLMFSGQQTSAVSATRWPAYTFPILALTCFSIPHCWPVHFLVNVTLKPHTHTHTHALMYTEATKHRYTDHCTTFHDLEFCHLHKYPTSRILFPIHVPRMHPSIHT